MAVQAGECGLVARWLNGDRQTAISSQEEVVICYECEQLGTRRDATAFCHHCSAALCSEHAVVVSDPVTAQYPVVKTIVLPLRARLFLCSTCMQALHQTAEFDHVKEHAGRATHEPETVHTA